MSDSALRRRIAPSVPLIIEYTDERGSFSEAYRVSFNLNVLAEISEKTGLTALSFDIWIKLSARVLRVMLWAALLPHQPKFAAEDGIEAVGSMLDGTNQEKAVRALWDAYLLYLPKDQADALRRERERAEKAAAEGGDADPLASEATEEPNPSPSDGSSSGPSLVTTAESPKAKSAS
jgi:hypothetical protein